MWDNSGPLSNDERYVYQRLNQMSTDERKRRGQQELYTKLHVRLVLNLGKKRR